MKKILNILVAVLVLISFFAPPLWDHIEIVHQRTLILLIISMILWTTNSLPSGISSLLIVGLQIAFGVVHNFAQSAQGFLGTSLYFILTVSLISKAMIKVGLIQEISHAILHWTKGNLTKFSIGLFYASVFLPFIMPSGNSRLRMFLPLAEELNRKHHLADKSEFLRFCTWALSGINQMATIIVFTGGGLAIVASQMIADYGFPLDWLQWVLMMAPPVFVICTIVLAAMWRQYQVGTFKNGFYKERNQNSYQRPSKKRRNRPFAFWLVVLSLILLLSLWILGPFIHVPVIVPPLLLVAVLSLPELGIIENQDLRQYDWENFLLMGAALSLAATIQRNGTASWIVDTVFPPVQAGQPEWVSLSIVIVITLVIRTLFATPVAALTVIFPLVQAYVAMSGLDLLKTMLTVLIITSSFMVLPIHSPIMLLGYGTEYVKLNEHIRISILMLVTAITIGFLSYFWYWSWVIGSGWN